MTLPRTSSPITAQAPAAKKTFSLRSKLPNEVKGRSWLVCKPIIAAVFHTRLVRPGRTWQSVLGFGERETGLTTKPF
jgi:hypothetical protein